MFLIILILMVVMVCEECGLWKDGRGGGRDA